MDIVSWISLVKVLLDIGAWTQTSPSAVQKCYTANRLKSAVEWSESSQCKFLRQITVTSRKQPKLNPRVNPSIPQPNQTSRLSSFIIASFPRSQNSQRWRFGAKTERLWVGLLLENRLSKYSNRINLHTNNELSTVFLCVSVRVWLTFKQYLYSLSLSSSS